MTMLATVATRVGVKPKEFERFVKFLIVGTIGAVVDFGTYNILISFIQPISIGSIEIPASVIAGTISFILAILSNFVWNRYWTYPDSRSKALGKQFFQFFIVNVSAIVIRLPIIWITEPIFERILLQIPALADSSARLAANLALAVAVSIVLFWNFFINRYWTYNDVD
jgi:putative flippase GtrA